MEMIKRELYLNKLTEFKDTNQVKVITGMRRCGKSTILLLFIKQLKEEGIKSENITYINFEKLENIELRDYLKLYDYLKSRIKNNEKNYIFLDEIQFVTKWEEVVNSLKANFLKETDIYITGSNAYFLSSKLATLLSGRYIEINILPLSFKEYLTFDEHFEVNNNSLDEKFEEYLKFGSLPVLFDNKKSESYFNVVLEGIYNTVLIKDILEQREIKNISLLDNIARYSLDNLGNMVSSTNISKFVKNEGIKTTPNTINNYIKALEDAYLIYLVKKYDIKEKNYLKTLHKSYIVDVGMRNAILGFRNVDIGHILENIVFLELKRRGYKIATGKVKNYEIDFIATNVNTKKYYQVTQTIKDENTFKRELRSLEAIDDNYEKIILSMDKTFMNDYNGIKIQNIIDFLLE